MTVFTVSKTRGASVGSMALYHEGQQKEQAGCDDYYLKGTADGQSAFFTGSALAYAGIKEGGTPKAGDYEKLFNGYRLDNGEDFLTDKKRKDLDNNNRIQVYSTAFNIDKSISVFYAATSIDEQAAILHAIQKAAENTMRYAEQEGKFTVRNGHAGSGENEKVSIMAACYVHVTSRSVDDESPDPQLHVHVEIANFGVTKDGDIKSLDAQASIFKRQAEYRALFDVDFFRQLENEGIDTRSFENDFIDSQGQKMGYGLQTRAVSDEQKDAKSKRRFQILNEFNGRTDASASAKSMANLATRSSKEYEIDYSELYKGWKESIGKLDLKSEGNKKPPTKLQVEKVLFKGQSVTTNNDLDRTAAQLAIGDPRGLEAIDIKKQEIMRELGITYCKDNDKITTKDFVKMEGELLRYAIRNRESEKHAVDETEVKLAINRFEERKTNENKEKGDSRVFKLNPEQEKAVYHLASNGFAILQGAASTGKSASLGALQEVYKAKGYTITGLAPSNTAADGLAEDGIDNAQTIQKLLLQIENKKRSLTDKDVLFFDEAGMSGTRELHSLMHYVDKAGAKMVLVGDANQLEAVGSASAFAMLSHEDAAGIAELERIARQNHKEDRAIAHAWLKGKPGEVWALSKARVSPDGRAQVLACGELDSPDPTDSQDKKDYDASAAALDTMYRDRESTALEKAAEGYLNDLRNSKKNGGDVLLLADTRADVRALNNRIREARIDAGEVNDAEGLDFKFHLGGDKFRDERIAQGDRVMFRKGDKDLGVKNGTTGLIVGRSIKTGEDGKARNVLDVQLDNGKSTQVSQQYDGFELAYATTVHKSQGMTVQFSHYLASDTISRRAAYVAGTRAKEAHTTYLNANSSGRIENNVREFISKETAIHAVRAGYESVALQEWQRQADKIEAMLQEQDSPEACARLDEINHRIDGLKKSIATKIHEADTQQNTPGWAVQTGGFDAMSEADQEKAKAAHELWQAGDPQVRHYGLHSYVDYVQEKHAEAVRREAEQQAQQPEQPAKDAVPTSITDPEAFTFNRAISAPMYDIVTQVELVGQGMPDRQREDDKRSSYDEQEVWTSALTTEELFGEGLISQESAESFVKDAQVCKSPAWIAQVNGFDGLSAADQAKAQAAHEEWRAGNPEAHTFGLHEYVSYVQEKHAAEMERQVLGHDIKEATQAQPEPEATPEPEPQAAPSYFLAGFNALIAESEKKAETAEGYKPDPDSDHKPEPERETEPENAWASPKRDRTPAQSDGPELG